jgi:FkbH-like protein
MTTPVDESALRAAIDTAIAEANGPLARSLLARLWRARPGPALSGYVVSRHQRLRTDSAARTRVFILRSCTFEPVIPVLRAQAFVGGIDLDVQIGDFNAYAQEILSPESPLYRFAPDVVVLAVHTADLAPELWDGFADLAPDAEAGVVERVVSDFRNWVRIFRTHSQAHLVVHSLEAPLAVAHGILDAQSAHSQVAAVQRINLSLREIARDHKGVYVLDYDGLVARHGRDNWHDARKWVTTRVPMRAERLSALASEWLRFLHPLVGKVCKALVVDLDNTLWGGVVGEDGLTGIKLGHEHPGAAFLAVQRAILDLYQRGIILAICSKNNEADALDALHSHPGMLLRPAHFAALKINWDDKAQNLRAIAQELNIGIDSLAFIDDNPAERALIEAQLPEVTVLDLPDDPIGYARALRESPVFERLTLSAEDRERGRLYAEERQRTQLQSSASSLEDFYRSLAIRVVISKVTADTLARTSQLTQKTNQFNLTTHRYSEQQIEQMAADPSRRVYTISASDRFGDNGLVGVAIIKIAEACEIDTLLLSCRVIGRTIETALVAAISAEARSAGATRLIGKFIPTKKNMPSRDFFANHGFSLAVEQETESQWTLDLTGSLPACPPWIDCCSTGSHESA